jgi:hypothetical protein
VANGPAIKRTERKVPTCYVGIARGRVEERACYRTFKALVIYPGAVKLIAGSGGVRVCQVIRFYPGSWKEKQKM